MKKTKLKRFPPPRRPEISADAMRLVEDIAAMDYAHRLLRTIASDTLGYEKLKPILIDIKAAQRAAQHRLRHEFLAI